MRIIISPAKKMNTDSDSMACESLPCFLDDAERIMKWMRSRTPQEARAIWECNEKLAVMNYRRFQEMELRQNLMPALLAYEGIQYQYMAPMAFTREAWAYVQRNLRILSGFYGVLRPLDGVAPYRLEMQAKVKIEGYPAAEDTAEAVAACGFGDLYGFWGSRIYQEVLDDSRIIINLASKEYSRCVEEHLSKEDHFITCIFGELQNDKVIQKGTHAKMARGEMVRFLAENQVSRPEEMRDFCGLGYRFREELSDETEYVFIKGTANVSETEMCREL